MLTTIAILLAFTATRIFNADSGEPNLLPLMALAFTGSAYLGRLYWIIPVLIMVATDIYINQYHGLPLVSEWTLVGASCYLGAALLGRYLTDKKSWTSMIFGTATMSLMFYFISNSYVFFTSPSYGLSVSEWVRALTTGVPGFPPTFMFLKNSLIADLTFTVGFMTFQSVQQLVLPKCASQA